MEREVLEDLVTKNFKDEAIAEITSAEDSSACSESEGYTSAVQRWKLKLRLNSNRTAIKYVISKSIPEDKSRTKILTKYNLMEVEIEIYEKIFTAFETLMAENGDTKGTIWCKMLGHNGTKSIILEDLQADNYKMRPAIQQMDFDHTMLVMYSLGRFHALSKVAFDKMDLGKDKLRKYALFQDIGLVDTFTIGGVITLENEIRNTWGPQWSELARRIKNTIPHIKSKLDEFHICDEEFQVFNHGDLWNCNVLFKQHDYKDLPVQAKFIDFQLPHYNSMAWDLTFFLYGSITAKLRRDHLDEFLDGYFHVFTETLAAYKYNGAIPTIESLRKEIDRFRYCAFLCISTFYAQNISGIEDSLTIRDIDDPVARLTAFNPLCYRSEIFKRDISQDYIEFMNENII